MDRVRLVRILISLTGILLGFWLMLGGLELRLLNGYIGWHQQITPLAYPEYLFGVPAFDLGGLEALAWPLVVFGTSWGGALVGFWIGEKWSLPAMTLLATLALPFPYIGTVLGIIQLLLIFATPEIRQVFSQNDDEA
jgi:hypothetical protein